MKFSWPRQVLYALLLLLCVTAVGGAALWAASGGEYGPWQSVYFAIIAISTVGYFEPPNLATHPGARAIVAVLILCGVGTVAFFNSTLTAFLVEGRLGQALRRNRMQQKISKLSGHIIVAGCGRTGHFCVSELSALKRTFVVIDKDPAVLERINEERCGGQMLFVVGDATDDHALTAAGVERASGLVASLTEDRDNVFVVLSARTLNPRLQIVAKSLALENEPKLLKAGADKLVSPHRIGGFRLVSELVRPRSMEFLDAMQAMSGSNLHMEDVEVTDSSPLVGESLRTSLIRQRSDALVVAIRELDGSFIHNPSADHRLSPGCHLIVVGNYHSVSQVRQLAGPSPRSSPHRARSPEPVGKASDPA